MKKTKNQLLRIFLMLFVILPCLFWSSPSVLADSKNSPEINKKSKVLIIYYSLTGNTRELALNIQKQTNGDIYEIELKSPYPADREETLELAKQQRDKNILPELKGNPPDLGAYDLVFLGAPVWWYTLPPPLRAFLAQNDFQGKQVAPFCTYGSVTGSFAEDLKKEARNAKLLKPLGITAGNLKAALLDETVPTWLKELE